MARPSEGALKLAAEYRQRLAGSALTPGAAKLYSQHSRLRARQPRLTWQDRESAERLDEAVRLIEAALIEREARGADGDWRAGLRRSAELLEWLSHPDIAPPGVPTLLLAAAAYQLAGYPARSMGLLLKDATSSTEADALRYLLSADFPALLRALTKFWAETGGNQESIVPLESEEFSERFHLWFARETMSILGILVAEMRWGGGDRVDKALTKFSGVSKLLLHGSDPYSWFLARLCVMVVETYVGSTMRRNVETLRSGMGKTGQDVLESYLRFRYRMNKALAWPSQVGGVGRLASSESFAFCAPTGSGKTTIAELAILQSLFSPDESEWRVTGSAPLVLYLVPKRALAAEVEAKLSELAHQIGGKRINVTGLYGGADWGPTDAWLTREERTVLICTYEKAEALVRFLGSMLLHRVSLVVIDEAHNIQFDGNTEALYTAESRPLRLEALAARLLTYARQSRVIALSAVAAGTENALASWVENRPGAVPVRSEYRSTRQLIGHIECLLNRKFEIEYDLLDGASLEFETGEHRTPYVPAPFPPYPDTGSWRKTGVEVSIRPYLFWAAMHLAAETGGGCHRSVLISVTQQIGGYADDLLELLESGWANITLPAFFEQPIEPVKADLWSQCLDSCKDYFGEDSREYRLLEKGIVLHHGKMPGRMARLLVRAIEERVVNLVIATSTLSEGLNLPFDTVLIPTLRRGKDAISVREFINLVGRAGRAGYSTEGRSFVLLLSPAAGDSLQMKQQANMARERYLNIKTLQQGRATMSARSSLAELLSLMRTYWEGLSGSHDLASYLDWLEQTAPLKARGPEGNASEQAKGLLDTLDSVLLAAIVEVEELAQKQLNADEIENQLKSIWQRCYAHYASSKEADLEQVFLRRGRALVGRIYPQSSERRRLYRTNLPPRLGARLLDVYGDLRGHLLAGTAYARWATDERFRFIEHAVELLARVPVFNPQQKKNLMWQDVLHWWLAPREAPVTPSAEQKSAWFDYVSFNFDYHFNWGLGNFIALAMEDAHKGQPVVLTLEEWPATGLPWVVFWLKDLIVWGTLEPVAAYLLSRDVAKTRVEAEARAREYLGEHIHEDANDVLNPSSIRKWAESVSPSRRTEHAGQPQGPVVITLLRDFSGVSDRQFRVVPVEVDEKIRWVDPAGFPLAESPRPQKWQSDWLRDWDFRLRPDDGVVWAKEYLPEIMS